LALRLLECNFFSCLPILEAVSMYDITSHPMRRASSTGTCAQSLEPNLREPANGKLSCLPSNPICSTLPGQVVDRAAASFCCATSRHRADGQKPASANSAGGVSETGASDHDGCRSVLGRTRSDSVKEKSFLEKGAHHGSFFSGAYVVYLCFLQSPCPALSCCPVLRLNPAFRRSGSL
jgi:hypothetical protein